jgi:hypothetical protein
MVYPTIPKKTVGSANLNQVWKRIVTGIPSARDDHTAVWTSPRMIVWGGDDNWSLLSDGAHLGGDYFFVYLPIVRK